MRVVKMHESYALSTPILRFVGPYYTLLAKRKTWAYGKTLHLLWGYEPIQACADKWTFTFLPAQA